VAVIGPPYYALDDDALLAHFAAARGGAPLPFYVYEFQGAERLRRAGPRGRAAARSGAEPRRLKVSDKPFEPSSRTCSRARRRSSAPRSSCRARAGPAGAVSGLASVFPRRGRARASTAPATLARAQARPLSVPGRAKYVLGRGRARCARTCARRCGADRRREAELDAWLESS
jgi:hypothetical protein